MSIRPSLYITVIIILFSSIVLNEGGYGLSRVAIKYSIGLFLHLLVGRFSSNSSRILFSVPG
jgi:hypothetical protein